MTQHGDQLREAFQTHENLAPDPAAVYARVQELARTYRRRRRGAQAAGGAVLGAGLLAGAVNLPSLLPGRPHDTFTMVAPAASPPGSAMPSAVTPVRPSVTPPEDVDPNQDEFDAYFGAGYGYDDAVKLAAIWKMPTDDIGAVKAAAGRRLLAGETLPVRPDPGAVVDAKEQRQVNAFFDAGYDYRDAQKLAELWKTADPYEAKVKGGEKLLAGETLPIRP